MKKIVFLLFFIMIGVIFFLRMPQNSSKRISDKMVTTESMTKDIEVVSRSEKKSIFVPYWVVNGKKLEVGEYDAVIYFGVTPNDSGINTTDDGYTKLALFNKSLNKGTTTLLTLRMLDPDTNFSILDKKDLQKKVITETIALAKQHDFSGIVLDLELNALPFDSVMKNITAYNTAFAAAAHDQQLTFAITLYGDTFYRFRPYQVSAIAKQVDQVLVMSYDFHKARGNPGPNFPFSGRDTYGYDFQKMTDDFLREVPAEKLSMIFGMFGYDWEVNEKEKAVGNGQSLSTYKVNTQFIENCTQKKCAYSRDIDSGETKVMYTADDNKEHIIWFEDDHSTQIKKTYLHSKGISSTSYWAYSYF